ncbi:g-protein alpha subunit, partial [Teladorsagia circumcincta]
MKSWKVDTPCSRATPIERRICELIVGACRRQDEQTKAIERQLHNERKILRRQVKILLLGSGESGKSTFIKQMNIIHGAGEFTADEVRAYRQQIYQNVISAMRVLLDARSKLNIPWEKPEREKNVPEIMRFTVADLLKGIDFTTFVDISSIIEDFWEDAAVKQTYEKRNLFQIEEQIASSGKVHRRWWPKISTAEWFQCFTDITSILFMVASNEYDQVILEDRRTNRVVESRSVFETIVNNRAFSNVSIILFMNKSDLLKEKVPKSDIRQYFSDFTGDHLNVRDVQFFLVDKFETSRKDRARPFFYHYTTAIDTENIRRVFID